MTWFRIDDNLLEHPKFLQLSDGAQLLWMRAGVWSARYLTEGLIPPGLVEKYGRDECAAELVDAGLWERAAGGFQFHDWLDYQPSKAQVEASRQKTAARVAKHRRNGVSNGVTHGVSNGAPVPSRPVSSLSSSENSLTLPTTTTSPSSAPENDQSGGGSQEFPPKGAEHEGYRWLHATLGTFPADLGSWRTEYRAIGSKPAEERERVALHVQATAWCMQHRSKCTPRHILKHWLEFLDGPRNFELKPVVAMDFKSQREAALKAATKARLEKFMAEENAYVALAKTPEEREKREAQKWDRYNRLDRSLP